MKRIAAFVCLLALASATIASAHVAGAPAIPWKTFSGPMVKSAINAQMVPCPKGEIFAAGFRGLEGDAFVMFFNPTTGLIVFLYLPDSTTPTYIGVGIVDPNKHDEIPPIAWRAMTPRDHEASVCAVTNPAEA